MIKRNRQPALRAILTAAVCLQALLLACGCSSVRPESHRVPPRLAVLSHGMSYAEVGRVLARSDPELKQDLEDAMEQERAAQRERKAVLAELRQAGFQSGPPLRSNVIIDRGDYVLVFNDGVLTSWAAR